MYKLGDRVRLFYEGELLPWTYVISRVRGEGELFEALRSLRKELATKEKLPPYMIFSDATLTQMATDKPTDLELMKNIRGVGEFKLQKYGEEFLTVIKSYIS